VLGDTLTKIAGEKAGIIKRGVPVVTAYQAPEAAKVISETAKRLDAPLTHPSSVSVLSAEPNGAGPQLLKLETASSTYDIRLPLLGGHQVGNTTTAIAALEAFGAQTKPLDPQHISAGISNLKWPGRVQVLEGGEPGQSLLIADGAHSHDSATALRAALAWHFGELNSPILVLGASGGHDPLAVARAFSDLSPRVVVTRSRHPKAVDPDDFANALRHDSIDVAATALTTAEALRLARKIAGPESVIIATGSLFVAAEAIETVSGIAPEMYPDMRGSAGPLRLIPDPTAPTSPR
jgi:dihydrofolate synthase/folylpolyglutamate synthase